jgi:hypothetical protein
MYRVMVSISACVQNDPGDNLCVGLAGVGAMHDHDAACTTVICGAHVDLCTVHHPLWLVPFEFGILAQPRCFCGLVIWLSF